jgi:hypothetical protein
MKTSTPTGITTYQVGRRGSFRGLSSRAAGEVAWQLMTRRVGLVAARAKER